MRLNIALLGSACQHNPGKLCCAAPVLRSYAQHCCAQLSSPLCLAQPKALRPSFICSSTLFPREKFLAEPNLQVFGKAYLLCALCPAPSAPSARHLCRLRYLRSLRRKRVCSLSNLHRAKSHSMTQAHRHPTGRKRTLAGVFFPPEAHLLRLPEHDRIFGGSLNSAWPNEVLALAPYIRWFFGE